MTLLNSNFEEWHAQNADKPYTDFPFSIKKMSASGCLFDFNKLNDVSKNVISKMSADEVYDRVLAYSEEFDPDFAKVLVAHPEKAKKTLAIGRGGKKPRKDFGLWSEVKGYMGFIFDECFKVEDSYPDSFAAEDIKTALAKFIETYDHNADANQWFDNVKAMAVELGYAADMKQYKQSPESFKGSVADICMFIRVAVTGKLNAPDLHSVMQILGKDRVTERIEKMINSL